MDAALRTSRRARDHSAALERGWKCCAWVALAQMLRVLLVTTYGDVTSHAVPSTAVLNYPCLTTDSRGRVLVFCLLG
jgi:hypothetical protein